MHQRTKDIISHAAEELKARGNIRLSPRQLFYVLVREGKLINMSSHWRAWRRMLDVAKSKMPHSFRNVIDASNEILHEHDSTNAKYHFDIWLGDRTLSPFIMSFATDGGTICVVEGKPNHAFLKARLSRFRELKQKGIKSRILYLNDFMTEEFALEDEIADMCLKYFNTAIDIKRVAVTKEQIENETAIIHHGKHGGNRNRNFHKTFNFGAGAKLASIQPNKLKELILTELEKNH